VADLADGYLDAPFLGQILPKFSTTLLKSRRRMMDARSDYGEALTMIFSNKVSALKLMSFCMKRGLLLRLGVTVRGTL